MHCKFPRRNCVLMYDNPAWPCCQAACVSHACAGCVLGRPGQSDMSWRPGGSGVWLGPAVSLLRGLGLRLGDLPRPERGRLLEAGFLAWSPIPHTGAGFLKEPVSKTHRTAKSWVRTGPERSSMLGLNTSMDGALIPCSQQTFIEYLLNVGHWGSRTELSK